jgi:tetratricopeptide (TPR) repeat protein
MRLINRLFSACSCSVVLCAVTSVHAIDTVYSRSTDKRAAGEVSDVSKDSVTVTPRVGSPTVFPANDIQRIEWDGEPPSLRLARSKDSVGQYALALDDYRQAAKEVSGDNDHLRTDIEYGIASVIGRMALGDATQQEEAVNELTAFRDNHSGHYRYFDALLLLGDVYLAQGDANAAESTFQLVTTSKWADYQMAANVKIARVKLARGDVPGARAAFDAVVGTATSSPAEESRRFEAMLGQASCLQQEGNHEEAARILGEVIAGCAPTDTRLQAEAYLRQGDAYAALGQRTKEAVMSYLHVDVIPLLAREKDLHAEALYRLTQLWPALGHPARADLAAGKLQSDYPNSEWAKKLTGG